MIADLCEVITYLEEDPHYTKEEAVKDLKRLLEMHMDPLYQKAIEGRSP